MALFVLAQHSLVLADYTYITLQKCFQHCVFLDRHWKQPLMCLYGLSHTQTTPQRLYTLEILEKRNEPYGWKNFNYCAPPIKQVPVCCMHFLSAHDTHIQIIGTCIIHNYKSTHTHSQLPDINKYSPGRTIVGYQPNIPMLWTSF